MRILLIPDKFKGSLTSNEVIEALKYGILEKYPNAKISSIIASDGGDGFLHAVSQNVGCQQIDTKTLDPLGREIASYYLYDPVENVAYIELAKASGIELLSEDERNAMLTSTYGTGVEIRHAIDLGAKTIYIGLGGSATNDGGIGIAAALGYSFLDGSQNELKPNGKNLSRIQHIQKGDGPDFDSISIIAINDVDNPLHGKNGAAYIYAQQKGANPDEIQELDEGLGNLDRVVTSHLNKDVALLGGSGAAGGTGFGLKAFLNAEFIAGIDFVLNLSGATKLLDEHEFDFIITGEGKLDRQTLNGKLIKGVVDLGAKYNIPVIAVCGQSEIKEDSSESLGLTKIIEIRDVSKPIQFSIENAYVLTKRAIGDYLNKL
jgi:glycerate 2-kinase